MGLLCSYTLSTLSKKLIMAETESILINTNPNIAKYFRMM